MIFEQGDSIVQTLLVLRLVHSRLAAPAPMTQDSSAPSGDKENSKAAVPGDSHLIEKLA
jgi:hypothetical protein